MQRPYSLFSGYFDFAFIGTFLLRATVGLIFIWDGYKKIKEVKNSTTNDRLSYLFGIIEIIIGILICIGLFTQLAVIFGVIISLLQIIQNKKTGSHSHTAFYILLLISSLSLFFLGPGIFAIDYPL